MDVANIFDQLDSVILGNGEQSTADRSEDNRCGRRVETAKRGKGGRRGGPATRGGQRSSSTNRRSGSTGTFCVDSGSSNQQHFASRIRNPRAFRPSTNLNDSTNHPSDPQSTQITRSEQVPNFKKGSARTPLPTYARFGYKRLQDMINGTGSDDIVIYISQNEKVFQNLLMESLRPDLLNLIMCLIVKIMDTQFRDIKLRIYSMICQKNFINQLNAHVTSFLVQKDHKNIVESSIFFKNASILFKDLINLIPSKAMESIDSLLSVCEVVLSRMVLQYPDFNELLNTFRRQIEDLNLVKERWEHNKESSSKASFQKMEEEPPNHYTEMSLYPTPQDLLERNFLRENIVEGSYRDVNHYLDVQFRLLREDFIEPLRSGIRQYRESLISLDKKKMKNFTVRIYHPTRFTTLSYNSKTPGDLSYFVQMDKTFASRIRWEYSKRLLFGSLCLFSRDSFETFQLATVSNRDFKDLKRGLVQVTLVGGNVFGDQLLTNNFVMAESSSFFDPVYQTLNTFLQLPTDRLPMERYILVKDIKSKPPKYLNAETGIDIEGSVDVNFQQYHVSLNDLESWEHCNKLGFNQSQLDAFKSMITNEFCVVQGPPGTGKTYLGLKFVKTLLNNFTFDSPILMVCYTNHALDQFLEGLLSVTSKIIRIGGQSKNEALNDFNYQVVKKKCPRSRFSNLHVIRHEMTQCLNEIASCNMVLTDVQKSGGILDILKYEEARLRGIDNFENSLDFLAWLLSDMYDPLNYILQSYNQNKNLKKASPIIPVINDSSDGEISDDEEDVNRKNYFEAFISENSELISEVKGEIHYSLSIKNLTNYLEGMQSWLFELNSIKESDEIKVAVITDITMLEKISSNISTYLTCHDIKPSRKFADLLKLNLWSLSDNDRWALYHYWIRDIHTFYSKKISQLQDAYSALLNSWKEVKVMEDYKNLQELNPKILGLTTTGAARHHALLSLLKPSVIVVEEAAEVLEAHIIVSLTASCEHLILIGDHKQLRPNPSTYKLAKDYHLDISLFERMIKNGVGCHMLTVQHRMKPNIADLIVPTIYSNLTNHKSVYNYPPVLGIPKNLFFINHNIYESKSDDMESSHSNPHEAEFIIALCRHLLLQGYKPSDITVLTTYSGQQFYLRDLKKKNMQMMREIRMTVVDNYQGEECKIILLSLVRSNVEGKIGFLGTENRICVALSRAKHGLYIIGNMDILKANSKIWYEICSKLEKDNAIGESLTLKCQIHNEVTHVKCAYDFNSVIEGGCSLQCLRTMPCGHICPSVCHVVDVEHAEIKCAQPCNRSICDEPDHKCPLMCFKPCEPCRIVMRRTLPQCGHDALIQCHIVPSEYKCKTVVKATKLDCKHEVERHCFQDINVVKCSTKCETRLDCGHACSLTCHVKCDPDHLQYQCRKDCPLMNLLCKRGHPCMKRCYEECGMCLVEVKQTINCGHTHYLQCSIDPLEYKCTRDCSKQLACGHKCKSKCFEPCNPKTCKEKVKKVIPSCGHTIEIKCSDEPTRNMCKKACQRLLICGHPCKLKCSQECSNYSCQEYVPSPVKPACGHQGYVICSKAKEVNDPTSDNLLKFCKEPCRKELPCSDICTGTCGSCMQGRIHKVCEAKCGNILICGHPCRVPCREECPPCKEKCLYRCKHSKCQKACGVPCTKCNELCEWSCKHFKCTRRCGEYCDREPCYNPCDKLLRCGHPCVGFCGEPCPPKCRICHKEALTELFFGDEDDEDARFVLLEDCEHILESKGLERWLNMTREDDKDQEIGVKGCPICKAPITRTLRFSNVSKRAFQQVQEVKNRIFGQPNEIRKLQVQLIDEVIPELKLQLSHASKYIHQKQPLDYILIFITENLKKCMNTRKRTYQGGGVGIKLLEFLAKYTLNLVTQFLRLRKFKENFPFKRTLQLDQCLPEIKNMITERFSLLTYYLSHRAGNNLKINNAEIEQFQMEYKRFVRFIDFGLILTEDQIPHLNSSQEAKHLRDVVTNQLKSLELFSNFKDQIIADNLNNLVKHLKSSETVTKEEINMVLSSMGFGMRQGHWYKCPNGHIYVVADCGAVVTTGKCIECKATVGGTNYHLAQGNQRFTLT